MVKSPSKRTNRAGKPLEPCAVYFRADGVPVAFQYRLKRRPAGARELP